MFWADKLAEDLKGNNGIILVDDMATPSGGAHVGTLRGAIIHDVAAKALRFDGKKARYTFVCNDMDPMDGLPTYLDEKIYGKYMGLPMFKIPAPEGGGNFSDFYMKQLYQIMNDLGCEFEEVWDSKEYLAGRMDEVIKTALDHADKIREIYKEVSGSEKPKDWIPFQPICENCGKIGTTRTYAWDGKEISYICEEDMVEWAKGCGYKGTISPFGGTGKLPWKVEWPAHWAAMDIKVEGEGKDHSSAGGSRDLANHLASEVFKIESPYDIPYEHIVYGGKKMSKSKGIGISAEEVAANLEPEIIRFLMIRHPERVIDLDLSGMALPSIYEEYDKAYDAYSGNIDFPELAQAYLYSQINKLEKGLAVFKFLKIGHVLQMPKINLIEWAKVEKGSKLTKDEIEELRKRSGYVKLWLNNFAPQDYKFEIQRKLPKAELSNLQVQFAHDLAKDLENSKVWTGEIIQNIIFGYKKKLDMQPRDIFQTLYKLFLGKDSGPQAGWLLASEDKQFVIQRLKEATK